MNEMGLRGGLLTSAAKAPSLDMLVLLIECNPPVGFAARELPLELHDAGGNGGEPSRPGGSSGNLRS